MNLFNYDVIKYPFKSLVEEWFDCDDLSMLHTYKRYKKFKRENDQSTIWHKAFYNQIRVDERFNNLYISFLKNEICNRYDDDLIYQKIPTFRVHFPNNVAVGEFHKDKDYRDKEWCKEVKEINYYLPMAPATDTNTFWAESQEDMGDYTPTNCNYGQCVEWDAVNLKHGNKINEEQKTRVSFDFRVILKNRYTPNDCGTINVGMKFKIGEYYEQLNCLDGDSS